MRSSHSLVAAGCVALGVVAIVLALVASVARATNQPQTTPTTGVPPAAATSVAIVPTIGAPALKLAMNADSASALPGSDIVFELSLESASLPGQAETRSFISGPADVVDVQATNGSCSVSNPVVCRWSPDQGNGSARIVARVAPDAAPGTTISAQSLVHTALSSAASSISSLQVSAPSSANIAQAATATVATITTSQVTKEGTLAQASATVLPPTIAPPTPTHAAATATTAPTGTATSAATATTAATEIPTPMPYATQAPTSIPTPETATLNDTLPETGTLPISPVAALGLAGCALLFVGVRRIRAADRALSAQQAGVHKLGTLVSAIGYVQRRTRIAADDMASSGEALAQKLENHTRR